MGDFSFKNIDDIKNLYESVSSKEEVDIEEGWWRDRGADLANASSNVVNAVTSSTDASIKGLQGQTVPENRRKAARSTNSIFRNTRNAVLDFYQGVSTGKRTPQESVENEMEIIENSLPEIKIINGKRYVRNRSGQWVDASGTPLPSATRPQQNPEQKPKPQYDPRRERLDLQVVQGGNNSGYRSLMPKPTAQKGETAQQLQARTEKWQKSQDLAKRLTQQVKDKQRAAAGSTGTGAGGSGAGGSGAGGSGAGGSGAGGSDADLPSPSELRNRGGGGRYQALQVIPADRGTSTSQQKSQDTSKPQVSQTGDKVKDRESWEKANPRLAEVERLRKQQRDVGKSVFDKEFRQNVVNPVMYGKKTVEDSKKANPDKPTPAVQAAQPPTSSKPMDTSKLPKKLGTTAGTVSSSYEYEPYDLVLEYLFSQGHVESLDEALYVMMEMDSETIQSICKR